MARDTQEELKRLSEELLAEEEPREPILEEPESWEEWLDFEEADVEEPEAEPDMDATRIYRNFSNNYGRPEITDYTDYGEEYPEEEEKEASPGGYRGLLITLALLTVGIVLVLIYWMVRFF